MWRSLRLTVSKTKALKTDKLRSYSSGSQSSGSGKFFLSVIAATGVGFTGAFIYGRYDTKFRKLLEENVPYINTVYKLFTEEEKGTLQSKKANEDKGNRDSTSNPSSLLKKKLDREKTIPEASKLSENVARDTPYSSTKDVYDTSNDVFENTAIQKNEKLENQLLESASMENQVSDLINKLKKSSDDAVVAYEEAILSVKHHTKSIYEAIEVPASKEGDIIWKEVKKAYTDKVNAFQSAENKVLEARKLIDKLRTYQKRIGDSKHPLVVSTDESISTISQKLQKAEEKFSSAQLEDQTAAEYQNLVNLSKEQFRKELLIVVPNYVQSSKGTPMSESDLNLLIAHAHRRIEQLQKQLAKNQVNEKMKIDEGIRSQHLKDEQATESKINEQLAQRRADMDAVVTEKVNIETASMKEQLENDLRQQLRRQAAAHADHIQEVLKVQEQELDRQFSLDLEEKLLHQKGVFISEISGNMARLKGILAYLKAKSEFDKSSKKAQSLWLACQSVSYKLSADNAGNPYPLAKDVANVKLAADEDSEFVHTVLASIPSEAVNRGVYNNDVLKERFNDVKKVCQRVALIDENNDSLYRYFISYLQSLFIVDSSSIPKEEVEGKVAVDPSEWDTFNILSRVSFSLQRNDLEQALRYANQLKGEPKVVAKDWINEVRLLLESQLAIKALLAHATAVGVQAYH